MACESNTVGRNMLHGDGKRLAGCIKLCVVKEFRQCGPSR